MPSEQLQSQSQLRAPPGGQPATSHTDLASTTPPHHHKHKAQKHVVGAGRSHAKVLSSKGLHKLSRAHGNEGSHTDLRKIPRNSSTTSLKRSSSHSSLKRNKSSADVPKRPSSPQPQDQVKRPVSVHFEIGDQEDAWEEASSSASPALSRVVSRSAVSSGQSSAKPSANNSRQQSPPQSPALNSEAPPANGSNDRQSLRHSEDAKIITERLLQRTPSYHTTQMSLATATPTGRSPDSSDRSQVSTLNGTPKIGSKDDVVSRFVGGSGTPSENSPFLNNGKHEVKEPSNGVDEVKRAKSMGNLTRRDSNREEEASALAPRSRKSSTTNAYHPSQQSRTQQKLWLQRASSNIEPQQMAPGAAAINVLSGLHGALGGTSLVGTGYDGRDPRIKLQLERTGLEYLVVRRHQDPVGSSLKRLGLLPDADKNRRIPALNSSKPDPANSTGGAGRYGLSQSFKDSRTRAKDNPSASHNGTKSSYEGAADREEAAISDSRSTATDDEALAALLRSIWEKNFDLSTSTD